MTSLSAVSVIIFCYVKIFVKQTSTGFVSNVAKAFAKISPVSLVVIFVLTS